MGSHTFFTALIVATLALSQLDSCLAQQCFQCNSTVDGNCLTAPTNAVDCTRNCFTSSDSSSIARGCLAENASCEAPNCISCTGDKCNTNLICYRCTGDGCNTPGNSTLGVCAASATAQCYTIGTSATDMQRGCASDTGAKCPAGSTDANCALCTTATCNNLQYERDAGTCIECTNCPALQEAGNAKSCGKLTYNQAAGLGCYTQNNGTVNRGCLTAELATNCTAANNCTTCTESACNLAAVAVDFQCYVCNTRTDAKCQEGVGAPVTKCENKCFSGYWNGAGIRGCWDQASALMQYQCVSETSHECKPCETTLCNGVPFSGAATLPQLGVGLLLGLIAVLRCAL